MAKAAKKKTDANADANADWLLEVTKPPVEGQRVKDMQYLLMGHNRYRIQTYYGDFDGVFGPNTGKAAKDMKWKIGYPDAACVPTAGAQLRAYLLPTNADGAQVRPADFLPRAHARLPVNCYPLARLGRLIGFPYQGTHTMYGNWESDRACDVSTPMGTRVLACFDGKIGSQFGPLSTHGDPHLLGIRLHVEGKDDEAYYAHLSSTAKGLKPGDKVVAGQLLGLSGSANGVAHLHFALKKGWPPTFLEKASL